MKRREEIRKEEKERRHEERQEAAGGGRSNKAINRDLGIVPASAASLLVVPRADQAVHTGGGQSDNNLDSIPLLPSGSSIHFASS